MIRETDRRRLLFDLDMSIMAFRERLGDDEDTVKLTSIYHNLLRTWADT